MLKYVKTFSEAQILVFLNKNNLQNKII